MESEKISPKVLDTRKNLRSPRQAKISLVPYSPPIHYGGCEPENTPVVDVVADCSNVVTPSVCNISQDMLKRRLFALSTNLGNQSVVDAAVETGKHSTMRKMLSTARVPVSPALPFSKSTTISKSTFPLRTMPLMHTSSSTCSSSTVNYPHTSLEQAIEKLQTAIPAPVPTFHTSDPTLQHLLQQLLLVGDRKESSSS